MTLDHFFLDPPADHVEVAERLRGVPAKRVRRGLLRGLAHGAVDRGNWEAVSAALQQVGTAGLEPDLVAIAADTALGPFARAAAVLSLPALEHMPDASPTKAANLMEALVIGLLLAEDLDPLVSMLDEPGLGPELVRLVERWRPVFGLTADEVYRGYPDLAAGLRSRRRPGEDPVPRTFLCCCDGVGAFAAHTVFPGPSVDTIATVVCRVDGRVVDGALFPALTEDERDDLLEQLLHEGTFAEVDPWKAAGLLRPWLEKEPSSEDVARARVLYDELLPDAVPPSPVPPAERVDVTVLGRDFLAAWLLDEDDVEGSAEVEPLVPRPHVQGHLVALARYAASWLALQDDAAAPSLAALAAQADSDFNRSLLREAVLSQTHAVNQLPPELDDDELEDDEARADHIDALLAAFSNSRERSALETPFLGWVELAIDLGMSSLGVTPYDWSAVDVDELLLDVFARKVQATPAEAPDIVAEIRAFARFLHRRRPTEQTATTLAWLERAEATTEVAAALGDVSRWGLAKSMVMAPPPKPKPVAPPTRPRKDPEEERARRKARSARKKKRGGR